MSLSLRPSLLPQCTSCTRRLTKLGLQASWRPSQQQVRGKKKLANTPSTVTVRLLKDVQTFGRKGAFVPISIGQMRNEWFPRRVAEYVTDNQLKDLKTRNIASERDFQFGVVDLARAGSSDSTDIRSQVAAQLKASRPAARGIEVERLTPERSIELLSILVPSRLDFYRQPIEVAPTPAPAPESTPQPQKARQQRSSSNAAADLLAARSLPPRQSSTPAPASSSATAIYGSVSTADIANTARAILAENDEAARIIFAEEDVRFINVSIDGQTAAETDKVKHLGEFEAEIRIKGADAAVRKFIRVLPQEKQDAN